MPTHINSTRKPGVEGEEAIQDRQRGIVARSRSNIFPGQESYRFNHFPGSWSAAIHKMDVPIHGSGVSQRTERRVLYWNGIIEDHGHTVASVAF